MRPFIPLVRNPHLLTILANFWPRNFDFTPFPVERRLIRTDEDTQILVNTQRPATQPLGEVVLLHGLEGSGDAGYITSLAWLALTNGFTVHRFHMRTCGGTASLCKTLYHAGLTSDLRAFLKAEQSSLPVFLTGFSLGGNVALKLAGEEGDSGLIQGVCSVCAPIDLGACARRIGERDNALYEKRFMDRMHARIVETGRFTRADVAPYRTLWDIDDRITAPSFGMAGAEEYYRTQSSKQFLDRIRVPALMIHAADDTFIPARIYDDIPANPFLQVLRTEHGGHIGYLSRHAPRFWVDQVVVFDFLMKEAAKYPAHKQTHQQIG